MDFLVDTGFDFHVPSVTNNPDIVLLVKKKKKKKKREPSFSGFQVNCLSVVLRPNFMCIYLN